MALLIVSTSSALLFAVPQSVPPKHGCADATLRGSYAVDASGSVLSGPFAGPTAIVGILTYDGIGGVTGSLTQRITTATGPITLTKVSFAGSYSVNADCTADDSLTNLTNGTTSTHEYVVLKGGQSFVILNTTTGPTVVLGHGQRSDDDDPD
jgi:hypothetical protein